jgi:HSP20 family molecular chaperone IbpA
MNLTFTGIGKDKIAIDSKRDHLMVTGADNGRSQKYKVPIYETDDTDSIKASYKDGLLTIKISSKEGYHKPSEIKID